MVYNIVKIHGYGRNIELKFHSRVTLLGGDSGIGKTLLYNILCTLSTGDKFKNLYCVNSNVVYRYNIDLIKTFKSQKNRLIVIDNADEILGRKEREFILTNFENQYLIIGRNRDGLGLGYNSLGELIVNNKQIYIRYKLKEESEEITRNMKNAKLRFEYAATNNYNMTAYSSQVQYSAPTFSEFWYQDTQGNWHIQDNNGNMITNAWLCDDAVPSNGQNIWYLIDSNGNMVSAGLVQDQTGNIYSLETSHNGYYGMLRYQSGAYDGVYLDLEASHGGSFAKIKNQEGVAGLQSIYGLTQVNIDNSNCVYTSSFRNSYQSNIPNGTDELKKKHPDDKVIVNGVDISQYLIDEETARKDAEESSDWEHEGRNAPGLN